MFAQENRSLIVKKPKDDWSSIQKVGLMFLTYVFQLVHFALGLGAKSVICTKILKAVHLQLHFDLFCSWVGLNLLLKERFVIQKGVFIY